MEVVNMYIVDEMNLWSNIHRADFAQRNCLSWAVKLTENADRDKYKYSDYGTGFDARGS